MASGSKKTREKRIAAGLCSYCGIYPPISGMQTCEVCREKRKLHNMRQYNKRREQQKKQLEAEPKKSLDEIIKAFSPNENEKPKPQKKGKPRNRKPSKESLCWHCDNYGCSWRQKLIPVKGWGAMPTELRIWPKDNGEKKMVQSYIVKDCPKFKREGHYANDADWESGLVSE